MNQAGRGFARTDEQVLGRFGDLVGIVIPWAWIRGQVGCVVHRWIDLSVQ